MGAKTLISPEEYLSTYYEHEPEYVRGELREKPMLTILRGEIVTQFILLLAVLRSRGFTVVPEVRCLMPNGNYRLPDVAVFDRSVPRGEPPTVPPLVAVEVLSDEQKLNEFLGKLDDYREWKVPNVWIVNPRFQTLEVLEDGALRRVEAFTLPEYGIEIRYSDLAG